MGWSVVQAGRGWVFAPVPLPGFLPRKFQLSVAEEVLESDPHLKVSLAIGLFQASISPPEDGKITTWLGRTQGKGQQAA